MWLTLAAASLALSRFDLLIEERVIGIGDIPNSIFKIISIVARVLATAAIFGYSLLLIMVISDVNFADETFGNQ